MINNQFTYSKKRQAKWLLMFIILLCSFTLLVYSPTTPPVFCTELMCFNNSKRAKKTISYKAAAVVYNYKIATLHSPIVLIILLYATALTNSKILHVTKLFNSFKSKLCLLQLKTIPQNCISHAAFI